jgi:uncharacterized protein YecE (DUF72 family)
MTNVRIAAAGWAVPRAVAEAFPVEGSALQRYAARFDAVEINTSFHRPHRPATYERWAQATPPGFRFAAKVPRTITHQAKLVDCENLLAGFLVEVSWLGDKLGPLLVQLPPSLQFDAAVAERFFGRLRTQFAGVVVCEPRHATWFGEEADRLLRDQRVGRVAADPAPHPAAAAPGGWPGVAYWRLHGSPRMYFSSYDETALRILAGTLRSSAATQTWCVFDNTASGAAAADALGLQALLGKS